MTHPALLTRRRVVGFLAWGVAAAWFLVGTPAAWAMDEAQKGDSDGGSWREDSTGGGGGHVSDVVVRYSDGWTERIEAGQYELFDPQSRLVVRRSATIADYDRMLVCTHPQP